MSTLANLHASHRAYETTPPGLTGCSKPIRLLKMKNGYSESWGQCQMKLESISKWILIWFKNFCIELNRDFWQP
jgi:hypothetical protein